MFFNRKPRELNLTFELVPSSCWGSNIRKVLQETTEGKKEWIRIRKNCYEKAGDKCEICGKKRGEQSVFFRRPSKMHCHEKWEYDDLNYIQKFVGFICLCEDCHMIKHHGFAAIIAGNDEFDYEGLTKHFIKVNNCTMEDYFRFSKEASKEHNVRSLCRWDIKLPEELKYLEEKIKKERAKINTNGLEFGDKLRAKGAFEDYASAVKNSENLERFLEL